MKRIVLFALALDLVLASVALIAQTASESASPANYTGWLDTARFDGFKADSIKYGRSMQSSDFENKVLLFLANDTNSAGFASDSIKFKLGYQRGYMVPNTNNKIDTTWRSICWLDTFSMYDSTSRACRVITASKTNGTDSTTYAELLTRGALDTSNVTGWAVLAAPVVAIWSPIIRPVIKGLTGNRIGGLVRVLCELSQRAYQSVRAK